MKRYTISDGVRDGWFLWLLLACLFPFMSIGAELKMEWNTMAKDIAGEPLAWNHSLWYVWTSATNHTKTNTVAQGWIPATTNAPLTNTYTVAVWSNALPNTRYWVRTSTVNVAGDEGQWSEPVKATAAPSKNEMIKVKIDG